MKVKTFQGRTMAEALAAVKKQFGREAVILTTRTVARGGLLGLGASNYVEITASPGVDDLPSALRRGGITMAARPTRQMPAQSREENQVAMSARRPEPLAASATRAAPPPEALLGEMGELKSLVGDLVRETRRSRLGLMPDSLHETYQHLISNAVAEHMAQQLVEDIRTALPEKAHTDRKEVRKRLAAVVEKMIPVAGPIAIQRGKGPRIVALIGPTGVGKTTTTAKLAANFRLRDQLKVGLITIDTYRIAAVEQLRTYAQIIDVPLEVVMGPRQLPEALSRLADRDVILIDTAGRSQRDRHKLGELQEYFRSARPDEVHLVLSSTCGEAVLKDTVEQFSAFGADRLIFTKLDEAIGFGVILNCLEKAKAKLSYVTTGQDVPDDIEVGQGRKLAERIVGI